MEASTSRTGGAVAGGDGMTGRTHRAGNAHVHPGNARRPLMASVAIAAMLTTLLATPGRAAAPALQPVREVRTVWTSEFGLERPTAVTYVPDLGELLVAGDRKRGTVVLRLGFDEDLRGRFHLPAIASPSTLAYDADDGVLTAVDGNARIEATGADLIGRSPNVTRVALPSRLGTLAGATFADGDWHVLDAGGRSLTTITSQGDRTRTELPDGYGRSLGPIAYDGSDDLVYVLTDAQALVGVDRDGAARAAFDLSSVRLPDPVAMTFAPSSDTTDDPSQLNLFVADSGDRTRTGSITELSLEAVTAAAAPTVVGTLVRTTHTSQWQPGSPDPSGVVHMPDVNRLGVVDSEVEEVTGAGYHGVNLWFANRLGTLQDTGTTYPRYSKEPTGLGYDQATGRLFISDDSARRVHIVTRGPDGRFGTSDDPLSFFDAGARGATDVEDPEFDPLTGALFFLDGVATEIYRVDPVDGTFGNANDVVSHFDIGHLGPADFEALGSDSSRGTLYVGARATKQIFEITKDGTLVRTIDVSGVSNLRFISGLTTAPASDGSVVRNIYLVDRAVDNGADSNENDGKLFEVNVDGSAPPGNLAPIVNAGSDAQATVDIPITLQGSVSDDGLPQGATVTSAWTEDSGPGTVSFGVPSSPTSTATFDIPGTYVLRLQASDTELQSSDTVTITVSEPGEFDRSYSVAAGGDDAEENLSSGGVSLTNSDLDLGLDGTAPSMVGLRFAGVDIPAGAAILSARVQFRADEAGSSQASFTIAAQASGNAPAFAAQSRNLSGRPLAPQTAIWTPGTWSTGVAGAQQQTPDISGVIQQIVTRPDWASGNAMVLLFNGTGSRVADPVEGGFATRLDVHYSTNIAPPNAPPIVNAGPDRTVVVGAPADLQGSVSDTDPVTSNWSKVSGPGTVTFGDASSPVTTATFDTAGSYVLELSGSDGMDTATDRVTVNVLGSGDPQTVEFPVTTGNDDVEQRVSDGRMTLNSSDLDLVLDNTTHMMTGLRFTGVSIPQGAAIESAYVQFRADDTTAGGATLTIGAEAAGSSAAFSNVRFDLSSRTGTAAVQTWTPPAWTKNEAGAAQRTSDIAAVVQEVVALPGWQQGNALTLRITGPNAPNVVADALEGAYAPRLVVTYLLP